MQVLSGAEGPAARTALLAQCVQQLEAIASGATPAGAPSGNSQAAVAVAMSNGLGPAHAPRQPQISYTQAPSADPGQACMQGGMQAGPQASQYHMPGSMQLPPPQPPPPQPPQKPQSQLQYPLPTLLAAAYPQNDVLSVVRRTTVQTVSHSPAGPLGPGSSTLSELCR